MKLKIIGSNGPFAKKGNACSCYLLICEGKNIVLDMGSGSLAYLREEIDLAKIDLLILSHLHYDHCADVQILKYAWGKPKEKKPLLFLPRSPESVVKSLVEGNFFVPHWLQDQMQFSLGDMNFSFHKMTHPVESYATKIQWHEKSFLYSGDTNWNHDIGTLAENVDLFLVDGGLLKKNAALPANHLTIGQACEIGKYAKTLLITHQNPNDPDADRLQELQPHGKFVVPGEIYTIQ